MLLLLVALCVVAINAGGHGHRSMKPHFLRLLEARTAAREAKYAAGRRLSRQRGSTIKQLWFSQRLNHFGRSSILGKNWNQRYWVNEALWKPGQNQPLFIQLGEEGQADGSMTEWQMYNYANQNGGALLAAVEHRFYGASQPTGNYADLSLLSVDQGLADFVVVIQALQAQYNISKVVVFGCSYIGSGAAWLRSKYPHVALAAVASSPPVRAVADFFLYLDQVDTSIDEQFGPKCNANIRAAMSDINARLKSNPSSLVSIFNLCAAPASPLDVSTFIANVAGAVMTVVQYDFEMNGNNVPYMCGVIGNASSPIIGLGKFVSASSPGCDDVSYADSIAQLSNVTYDPSANMRQWTWQTCTEFGYFQTTTSPKQPFSEGNWVPLSYWERMCNDAFRSTFNVTASVADTNARLGGNVLPQWYTTQIVYDNSIVDPWHTLSVQQDVNSQSPLYTYNVRGHCAAVSPESPSDPPELIEVRKQIQAKLNEWLR